MKVAAAVVAMLVGLCGSAWATQAVEEIEPNQPFASAQVIPVTDDEVMVEGAIEEEGDDPADYFAFTGLSPNSIYSALESASNLALLLLHESGDVLDYRAIGFPIEFESLRVDEAGELYLGICSLGDGTPGEPPYDCEVGATTAPYMLLVEYVPEPGAGALQLAALLTLLALARRRA